MSIAAQLHRPTEAGLIAVAVRGPPPRFESTVNFNAGAPLTPLLLGFCFLLALKFRQFGAQMGDGMMPQLRLIHPMVIMFPMMGGVTEKRPVQEGPVNALLEAERVAEATKHAIKCKIAQAASVDFQSWTAKLRLEPEDPEDKAAKRKKIHAFKSKMRLEQLEVTQNKRQNAWQQFQSTKGKTKKDDKDKM
ncbi:hypothetical protein K1719_038634 [Acacia pycnantha]|nr:hypothetical protein K1719_038634 [Acacia pycnantha]